MKKSLLVTNFYPPEIGGIQNYLHNLISRLPEDQVAVVTDKQENAKYFDERHNHPTYRRSFTSPLRHLKLTSLDLYRKTLLVAKKEKADILLAGNFYLPALTCYWLKKINKLPYYIFTYGTETTELWNAPPAKQKMARKILAEAEGIITISDYLKEKLVERNVPADKITKIYPGVDFSHFKPEEQKTARDKIAPAVQKGLATPQSWSNANIILSVGRLVERKGHDMVIKSLPAVLQRFPNTLYLIIGDGPYKKKLKALVKELGLEKYVLFVNDITKVNYNDLPDYYNVSDVFTMPSRIIKSKQDVEGFGIVYLEASACAKPIVAGHGGGVNEAVVDNQTGLLVNSQKPAEISQAITKLLLDSDLADKLGQNGRERVEKEFDWDKLVKKLNSLLA
ncbi:MAG: glycosyltransferase family 4 protein [Parcubacteria group bacterium]|nr:glycosyltransferase family 4 protein [Parcubacteria group bacterium]